jgi:5-methylcytosine-specific restriction endonuclease McrA
MSILHQQVLVLNRNWQAIGTTSVEVAFCDMFRGNCTGIDTDSMRPLRWNEWVALKVEGREFLRTIRGPVRVPTVICKESYAKMPKRRPKMNRQGVGDRDHRVCGYSGEVCPDGTLDHVVPKSRGGKNEWTNVVWARKDINHRKANRTPAEAGLKLLRKPFKPLEQPVCVLIRPQHPDWKPFLAA